MKKPAHTYGIDVEYLRRCKNSTPEQRLEWLVTAQEFVREVQRVRQSQKKK